MSIYQKVMESKQLASEVHEFLASGGQIKTYQGCEFTHKPEHTTRFLAKKLLELRSSEFLDGFCKRKKSALAENNLQKKQEFQLNGLDRLLVKTHLHI
ncbi:hypothetical protein MKR65_15700 [Acinetobacter baumannii]